MDFTFRIWLYFDAGVERNRAAPVSRSPSADEVPFRYIAHAAIVPWSSGAAGFSGCGRVGCVTSAAMSRAVVDRAGLRGWGARRRQPERGGPRTRRPDRASAASSLTEYRNYSRHRDLTLVAGSAGYELRPVSRERRRGRSLSQAWMVEGFQSESGPILRSGAGI